MQLERIEIENFLSIKDRVIFDFSNRGLVLVSGPNGAGKSTLAGKALCWALFGKTTAGIRGDSVATRNSKERTEVTVYLNGTSITRTRCPNSVTVSGSIYREQKEAQEAIYRLVGRTFEDFLHIDFFGQSRFLELTPKIQLELLENIVKLDRLDKFSIEASKRKIEVEKKKLENRIERTKYEQSIANAASSITWDEKEVIKQKHSLDQLDQNIQTRTEKLNSLRESILNTDLEDAKKKYSNLVIECSSLSENLRELEAQFRKVGEEIHKNQATLSNLNSKLQDIQDKICPLCKQEVDIELTERLKEEQRGYANEEGEIKKKLEELLKESSVRKSALEEVNNKRKEVAKQKDFLFIQINSYESEAPELEKGIEADEKSKIAINSKIETLNQAITKQRDLKEKAETALKQAKEEQAKLEREEEIYKFWQKAFSKDFKNFVLDAVLPFLEDKVNETLEQLNNSQLKVSFNSIKELKSGEEKYGFNVKVSSEKDGESFGELSGGEQQIVSFAVQMALCALADAQSGAASNVIILDEPFTELDSKNSENVVYFLSSILSGRKETTILISNDDRMKSLIPNIVQVYKTEEGTKIN